MASALDMSLDEIIAKEHAGSGGKSRNRGSYRGRAATAPYDNKAKTCNNCGVLGHLAGQCPEPPQCHACGSTAHAVAECPHREKACATCGKVGHLKAKCRQQARSVEKHVQKTVLPAAPARKANPVAGKTCNNCGVLGHLAGQCPEPPQCHACGSTAHAVAECPHREKACAICGKTGHLKAKCRQAQR
ncbi:hypothetical protein AB1Y20_009481 [Prymnesium parvum]|uniref:CCHC-type domain-containing protein n=1 Tax=Prymnesium parvum TaxID=97485 RepID=A0AB34K4L1_PRYPA|mmetsp:Transcript_22944/g.34285  ORF Transcript_22944/g.34285 Transcript_22944/m.34285 type:complete len:188 (+) Transcript_22944:50-613(+)